MLKSHCFSFVVVAASVAFMGCAAPEAENPVGADDFAVGLETQDPGDPDPRPPGSNNLFNPGCFWNPNIQAAYRLLAQKPLYVDAQGNISDTISYLDQVTSACRNQALKYLARCALPEGSSMTDPDTNITYNGWLGLADQWKTQVLSSDNQWWVTSCLLEHLNGYGIEVPILLQGDRSELQPTSAQITEFQVPESRAWGNLFAPNFVANVCYFTNMATSCYVNQLFDERICDTSPYCNLNLVGNCNTACFYNPIGGFLHCGSSGNKHISVRVKDYDWYGSDCEIPE
ncbi:hypothetical protein [Polyangium jinanense]|uniref:Lipoprotein n=1 Tax=Polyangium jinanense TaxID=2829994 RepID=A0A9X3X168_9BACT|nr:hypothetical protein [Polyangium jinanense]MDC3952809.1 hypothetical protein [Polyangium jinanense]MDC3980428.1 hypothetical protein [Polyangium jinanense]